MNEIDKEFTEFMQVIGENIKHCRETAGFTQEEMDSGEYPIEYKFYQQIEYGKKNIALKTLYKICKKLKVDPANIFTLGREDS